MPTPQEQLIDQKYKNWWIQAGYWMLNQGGGIGTGSVVAPVSVTITGDTSVTTNNDVTLTANVNPGNVSLPLTYTWNVDGGTITSGTGTAVIDVQWSASGSKAVSVTVSNSAGSANDSHTVTVSSPSPLLTDLVAYWKLDDLTWVDTVGSNDLTNNGSVTVGTPKLGAGSAEFDGTNYLANSNPVLLSTFEGDFSLSYWLNAGNQIAFPVSCGRTNNGFATQLIGSNVIAHYNGLSIDASDQDYTDNAWHHIVVTVNRSGNMELFTDGTSRGTVDISATAVPDIQHFQAGLYLTSTYYIGLIDEIGVWSRVLPSGEIGGLYNSGSGLSYPF